MTPPVFSDPDQLAEEVVRRVGRKVVLGLPLGLGKATHLANALYARAEDDPSIDLTIFTALTLEAPHPKSELERRFLGSVLKRTLGGYPRLAYAEAAREGRLPPNIKVDEFFFQAGTRLHSPAAQQAYISANYTHAIPYLLARGLNVVGQLVAGRGAGATRRLSLSCNSDTTLDLLKARREGRASFLAIAQLNAELPFMGHDADVPADAFDLLLEGERLEFPLFAPPKEPVEDAHYAIGLRVAALVPDGGTLQLGIGSTSDAICQGLILRQREPKLFAETVARLDLPHAPPPPERHAAPFETGLYACTEMFVDGFLHLYRAGVLKREVEGAVLHGGFFIGPRDFYQALRELPEADLARFAMTAISYTNQLYGDEAKKRAERPHARFANAAMMATLMGEAISDGLEDGRVVSGVGGQYDFVAQAFALGPDARSILTLNATRQDGAKLRSNIRWSYGGATIPRHLRDVVVTEYGVADLRGRSDAEVISAMLAVSDARFQASLLARAKSAGKLAATTRLPPGADRINTPERIAEALAPAKAGGALPLFPFGTDFSDEQQALLPALGKLKAAQGSPGRLAALMAKGLHREASPVSLTPLGLDAPQTAADRALASLVRGALANG